MISWLQTRFQRHYKILFLVLLAIVIVAFVFTIGAQPGIGTADGRGTRIEVFGQSLSSERDQRAFFLSAQLSAYFLTGSFAIENREIEQHAFQRLTGLHLARTLGIPGPGNDQLTAFIRTLPAFQNEEGVFDPQAYTRFLDEIDANPNLSQGMLSRVLAEDFRIQQVQDLLGGPGYVLPAEIRRSLAQADTVWTIEVGYWDYSAFTPAVFPTDGELEDFFAENRFRFEVAEQVRVQFVEFQVNNFKDGVLLRESDLRTHYEQNRTRFPVPESPSEVDSAEVDPFRLVRDLVEADLRQIRARQTAQRRASDLTFQLFEGEISLSSPAFSELLESYGLTLRSAPAFTATQPPPGLGWNRSVLQQAFLLDNFRYFSDPVGVGDRIFVLFLQERIAPHVPPLEQIRGRVESAYIEQRSRELTNRQGQSIREEILSAMESGLSFREAAAEAGVDTRAFPPFTRREPPEDMDWSLLNRLDRLSEGQVSEMVLGQAAGTIIHVTGRLAPEPAPDSVEFALTMEQMAQMTSNLNRNMYLDGILSAELRRAGLTTDR